MKKQLKSIERGQPFTFADQEWIALEHNPATGTTLMLMADILENRAFDNGNIADWRESSAREYLNHTFLDKLVDAAGSDHGAIITATVDLTADDGTFRETCTDNVFLLSAEQYRRNRDIIEPIDSWWWTLTRWSASDSCNVRGVSTDGSLDLNNAYYGSYGLRPALSLSSDLWISDSQPTTTEEIAENAKKLAEAWYNSGYSTDDVIAGLAELSQILKETQA